MNDDLTAKLASFAVRFRSAELTGAEMRQMSLLVADHLAASFAGATTATAKAARSWSLDSAAGGGAYIVGSSLTRTPAAAAFANAAAAHAAELDDTHEATLTHPGAVVIAATLAAASKEADRDADVFGAIAAGYEVMTRIAAATDAALVARAGFHPTSLFGGFGAAASVAHLRKLSAAELCAAWGIALSRAGGSMQFADEPRGGEIKPLHAAFAAESGVIAVELVTRGVEAPLRALDGRYGLANIFGRGLSVEAIAPCRPYAIATVALKLYPSCRMLHPAVEAVLDCLGKRPPAAIRAITISGPRKLVEQHMMRNPLTPSAARYSLPCTIAAAIRYGPESLWPFDHIAEAAPVLEPLASRVSATIDPELDRVFPRQIGSKAVVSFEDGTVTSALVRNARGSPQLPLTSDDVFRKLGRCAALLPLELDRVHRIAEAVRDLAVTPDTRPLQGLLRAAHAGGS
ncbi:MAG TPA: MmgE/PrpD family protein [Thermoanaerobaculia bacterium]